MVPRLRKSGSAGRPEFCLIIGRIYGSLMQASCRLAPADSIRIRLFGIVGMRGGRGKKTSLFRPQPTVASVSFFSQRTRPGTSTPWPRPSPRPTPPPAAGRAGSASRLRSASSAIRRRSTSIAGSRLSISQARSHTPGCWRRSALSLQPTSRRSSAEWRLIRGEIERGEFTWSRDFEDVHLNIEHRLTALAGDAGKRLHTARSRNDQVATDLRLWLRGAIDVLADHLAGLRQAILDLAERHADTIMPGFTHLQVAQPVTFGHHLLAYDAMLARDMERLADCRRRVNRLPLGAAALAGTSYPIDREQVAHELGFDGSVPEFARRRVRPRFRDRIRGRRDARHAASVALRGGTRAVDEPAIRLRAARRSLLHRQLDHAAEEEPRCPRARARKIGPRRRRPDGA